MLSQREIENIRLGDVVEFNSTKYGPGVVGKIDLIYYKQDGTVIDYWVQHLDDGNFEPKDITKVLVQSTFKHPPMTKCKFNPGDLVIHKDLNKNYLVIIKECLAHLNSDGWKWSVNFKNEDAIGNPYPYDGDVNEDSCKPWVLTKPPIKNELSYFQQDMLDTMISFPNEPKFNIPLGAGKDVILKEYQDRSGECLVVVPTVLVGYYRNFGIKNVVQYGYLRAKMQNKDYFKPFKEVIFCDSVANKKDKIIKDFRKLYGKVLTIKEVNSV